jgi:hypothetical protein
LVRVVEGQLAVTSGAKLVDEIRVRKRGADHGSNVELAAVVSIDEGS